MCLSLNNSELNRTVTELNGPNCHRAYVSDTACPLLCSRILSMPPVLDPSERISLVSTGESSRLRRRPAVVLRPPASGPLAIYCGAQDPITAENISEYDYDEHRPWTEQILPDEQLPPPPLKKSRSSRSNGCGAQVHGSVCMMRRNQCWYGSKEELAPTVVPLETFYFPSELVQVLDLSDDRPSACGCVLDGIGCAVW